MKVLKFVLLGLLLSLTAKAFSQNEITLINGMVYKFKNITVDSNWVQFDYLTHKNKLKQRQLNTEDVFSIKKENEVSILYKYNPQDTLGMLNVKEMGLYVLGQQEGRATYNGTKDFIMGAAVGVSSGIILNSVVLGILVPPAYTLITTAFPVNKKHFNQFLVDAPDLQKFGRRKQYKKMRTGTAIKSSFAGLAVGLILGGPIARQNFFEKNK